MLRLIHKLPRKIAIAVSGGCDSMAALDFLRRAHDVLVLHYNHGTQGSDHAQKVVSAYCASHQLNLVTETNYACKPKGSSLEDFWRKQRYDFFDRSRNGLSVVTCHHLDDAVETWLFSATHGNPYLIPSARDCYIRPFLTTRKKQFQNWCNNKNVKFAEDKSNSDTRFMRNFIRHEIIPKILNVNPGIHKTIAKKITCNQSCNHINN